MPRRFATSILLPADPTAALEAATKGYVDAAAALLQPLSGKGSPSGYASLDAATKVPVAQMPVVSTAVRPATVSTSLTIDASGVGNIVDITATGNITLAAPTSPVNGQQLRVNVLASGAARTVTFTGLQLTTGLTTLGPYSVPSGAVAFFLLTYTTLRGTPAWYLTAAQVGAA